MALSAAIKLIKIKIQMAQLLDNKLNEKYLLDEFQGKITLDQNQNGQNEITAELSKINCEICFSQFDYFISLLILGLQQMKYLPLGNASEQIIPKPVSLTPSLPNIKLRTILPEFRFILVDDKDNTRFPLFLFQIISIEANLTIAGSEQNAQLELEDIKLELKTKFKNLNKERPEQWKRYLYYLFIFL